MNHFTSDPQDKAATGEERCKRRGADFQAHNDGRCPEPGLPPNVVEVDQETWPDGSTFKITRSIRVF